MILADYILIFAMLVNVYCLWQLIQIVLAQHHSDFTKFLIINFVGIFAAVNKTANPEAYLPARMYLSAWLVSFLIAILLVHY